MPLLSLQKTLGLLAMPMGLVWLGLLALVAWCWWRQHRGTAVMLAGLAVVYAVMGNVLVGGALVASLELHVPQIDLATVEPFEAVFVLGGGSELDLVGHPQLGSGGDRVAQAARLYNTGKARCLVASGRSDDDLTGPRDLAQETRALWLQMGVPATAIQTVTDPCWITREEIAAYQTLCRAKGWKRIAVVSSAWHLPRAMALAQAIGLTMTPIGADWRGRDQAWRCQDFVPTGQGALLVQLACWEYLGRAVGR